MKKTRIRVMIAMVALCLGCNHKSVPIVKPEPQKISIAQLKSQYNGVPVTLTDDISIRGRVISSDDFGGWYKTLVVEDATAGVELCLDLTRLCERYLWGSLLDIYCNGLTIGGYGGVIRLGGPSDGQYEVGLLSAEEMERHIAFVEMPPEAPTMTTIKIGELRPEMISRYLCFNGVEFIAEELGQTLGSVEEWANRHIIDIRCDTLTVRIPPNNYFALLPIPSPSGRVSGILSFFNGSYELRLNKSTDMIMKEERF